MQPSRMAAIREGLGLTQEQLGAALGRGRWLVSRMENGQVPIPCAVALLLGIWEGQPHLLATPPKGEIFIPPEPEE